LIIALISAGDDFSFWLALGTILLFVQWIVLISAGVLCLIRRWLPNASDIVISALIVVVFVASTLLASALAAIFSRPGVLDTDWFYIRNSLIALLASFALARYLLLQQQWKSHVFAESSSRLMALQARIQPHFLFNSLNTIAELIHSRPVQAEEALLDLSDLLRTGLRSEARHSLEQEFELIRGYLRIEGLRLGERLDVKWSIDESVDRTTDIPALLIQPLVENAVLHGIASLPDGGRLTIRLEPARFGRARIIVENPLPSPDQPRRQGNRTALENIRQRLALAYEEGASLKTEKTGALFRAVLTFPLKTVLSE